MDRTPPTILATPLVTDSKDTYAIIEWITDEPAIGSVEYEIDTKYRQSKASKTLTQYHRIIIAALDAETIYHF